MYTSNNKPCAKSGCATFTISNKLLVIEGVYNNNCELFDSIVNKFDFIETQTAIRYFVAVSIGYKVFYQITNKNMYLSEVNSNFVYIFFKVN